MSDLLIVAGNTGVTTRTIACKGSGDYVDSGVMLDGRETDFSICLAFFMDGTYTSTRYVMGGGSDTNRVDLVQTGIRTVTIRLGMYVLEGIILSGDLHALVLNYDLMAQTVTFAFDGDTLSLPSATTFDSVLDTSMKIGINGEPKPSLGYDQQIGIGHIKTSTTTETDWQTFWSDVQALYTT